MVEKAKIRDAIYDIIDYTEFSRHPSNYGKFNAVKSGDFIYPIKNKTDSGIGIYDNDDTTYEFVVPKTEEEKKDYSVDNIINLSNCANIKEVIKAQESLRNSERAILTKVDNIYVANIGPNDTSHMVALKEAINAKEIDLDKYEPRFGANYNNDRRLLIKDDITMNKFKTYLDVLDLKATLIIEDASEDVPNPMGQKIVVQLNDKKRDEDDE